MKNNRIVSGNTSVPANSIIVAKDQFYSKNDFETRLNNNVLVVGTSGCGKTRTIVEPNLLQAEGSYVISDPKGNLHKKYAKYLKDRGYEVVVMDFVHPEQSARYNPILHCKNTNDIMNLAFALVYELNAHRGGHSYDPFWDEATMILLSAIIAYLLETDVYSSEEKTLVKVADLIKKTSYRRCRGTSEFDLIMRDHLEYMAENNKESWAFSRYQEFESAPDRTHDTISITSLAKLATLDTEELHNLMSGNDIDFTSIGEKRTAVFVIVSDTDRSKDVLVNLFYSQLLKELCAHADERCKNSRLPVPVQFILDDFATNARINNFQNIISNIRSRGISTMLMLQSESQLRAYYGEDAQTIIDNCNTYVYMGGGNPTQARSISERANKSMQSILNMPVSTCWVFRRGQEPTLCDNFDLEWFQREKGYELEVEDIEEETKGK